MSMDRETQPGMSDDDVWQASEDVVTAPLGDELALLDFKTNTYFTANRTTAHVWSILEAPRGTAEVVASVAHAFGVPEDACREDVTDLLATLQRDGLVRRVPQGASDAPPA